MGMTFDAHTARPRRMPAPVVTAAILLGFFGGLFGFGALALGAFRFGEGGEPLAVIGGLVLFVVFVCVVGMIRGNRGAQIAAAAIGGIAFLGSLYTLSQGTIVSVVWLAAGATIALLTVAPMSSREWFSR